MAYKFVPSPSLCLLSLSLYLSQGRRRKGEEEENISLVMGKLKSSMRSLQEAINSLNPIAPICIQEAKTQSFRTGEGPCSSFSYVYGTPSTSSSSSSLSLHKPKDDSRQQPPILKEDSASSSSLLSSSSAASSLTTTANPREEETLPPPDGRISSKRFFFTPRKTKFIMEELKEESGDEAGGSFYEESEAMAMVSEDPYGDFKSSLAEMVEAHELRDWPRLQELLHCYLRLNDRKMHKIIVLAFVDLIMQLVAHDREIFPFSSAPLCLHLCDLDM